MVSPGANQRGIKARQEGEWQSCWRAENIDYSPLQAPATRSRVGDVRGRPGPSGQRRAVEAPCRLGLRAEAEPGAGKPRPRRLRSPRRRVVVRAVLRVRELLSLGGEQPGRLSLAGEAHRPARCRRHADGQGAGPGDITNSRQLTNRFKIRVLVE